MAAQGGAAGFKKGKPGISGGIRARGSPGISAGDHGNALLRGATGKAEPTGGVGRAGSQGSRPARARAGLRVRERGRGLAEALAWARAGLGRARGKKSSGPKGEGCVGWVWNQAGLGSFGFWASSRVWAPFLFSFLFSFLNLIQSKFEFKFEFEFKPHSNKIMHQHECNKKFKPMINFN